jgi:ABC-type multidrug transport system fused ATPase/permease subunit
MIRAFWRFRTALRPYRLPLAIGSLLVLLVSAADIAAPWTLKVIVDNVLNHRPARSGPGEILSLLAGPDPQRLLAAAILALVLIVAVSALSDYLSTFVFDGIGERMTADLRAAIFAALQRQSLSSDDRQRVGDLTRRITADVNYVQEMLIALPSVLLPNVTLLAGIIAVMILVDAEFALISLVTVPALLVTVMTFTRRIKRASKLARKKEGELASAAAKTLSSMRVDQADTREARHYSRFHARTTERLQAGLNAIRLQAKLSPSVDVITACGIAVILWFGAQRVLSGEMSLGLLLVFLAYLSQLHRPIRSVAKLVLVISRGRASADRIQELLSADARVTEPPDVPSVPRPSGAVAARSLTFGYDAGQPVLQDVSIEAAPGEIIAPAGPTGAGKSTIVSSIRRFYDPWHKRESAAEETPEQPHGEVARAIRLLLRFTEGDHRMFVLALLMLILEAASAVFAAYPLAYLIDYLRGNRSPLVLSWLGSERTSTVVVLTLAVVVITMINSFADSAAGVYLARGGRTLGMKLRATLFAHLQRLSLAFHERRRTGEVTTRVTGDVKELEEFVINSLSDVAGSLLLLGATLAFLLANSWQVTIVGLLIIPVLVLVSSYFSRRIKAAAKKQRAREGDLASATQEMLASIRVVQTFGRGGHEEERFAHHSERAMQAALEAARLEAWFGWVVNVLQAVAIGAVIWLGIWLIDRDAITVGMLVLFTILIGQMFKPTRRIIKEWNRIGKVIASVERVAELLDREPAVQDGPGAIRPRRVEGAVEFRGVSFMYELEPEDAADGLEWRPALDDVSFRIGPGEVVALVGPSGAGKTTIAQLLPRLYDPQKGKILLDGRDIRGLRLDSLRAQISVVLQETVLFTGTVAENIAYGRKDATRKEIIAAAMRAHAHGFIERLPDGYATELSERAANLSGGQRQRIAIARAFIRNTPILILDEPTSGLDAESTHLVLLALRKLMREKATLLISHDLRLIRSADRIIVLENGKIVEEGTHDALIARNGLYAQLDAAQFGATGKAAAASAGNGRSGQHRVVLPPSALAADARRPPKPLQRRRSNGNGRLHETALDPLKSPALEREFPGVSRVFNAEDMKGQLETLLASGWTVERCKVGKAFYEPGEALTLRYGLDVRNGSARKVRRTLVGARLFRDCVAPTAYVGNSLEQLAVLAQGREEMEPFATPVAALESPNLAAHVFPIDAELPTLIPATDQEHMLGVLQATLPDAFRENLTLQKCSIKVVHYPRRSRCLLRYDVEGTLAPRDRARRLTVYGKLGADHWPDVEVALLALREWAHEHRSSYPVRVPRLLAVFPELQLGLLQALHGTPLIVRLVKASLTSAAKSEVLAHLKTSVDACAWIAAALHTSDVNTPATRPFRAEVDTLRPALKSVGAMSPPLGEWLTESLADIVASAAAVERLQPTLCHGDYTHSQILFDGRGSGIVDLGSMCRAEPALDLGQFCAYLRVACRKAGGGKSGSLLAEQLVDRFLASYAEASDRAPDEIEQLHARVAVWEAISLLRMAVHSWHQLKAERTANVLAVLEERMSWLLALSS